MGIPIQDQEEFDILSAKYKQLKAVLPPEEAKASFASAFLAERIQAVVFQNPTIVSALINQIEEA
jgi:hypothetical protein